MKHETFIIDATNNGLLSDDIAFKPQKTCPIKYSKLDLADSDLV